MSRNKNHREGSSGKGFDHFAGIGKMSRETD
jgi:hypothetical protein